MAGVGFDAQSALGSVSYGDRCADFMRRAFPDTRIDVKDQQVSAGTNPIIATVQGERRNVPETGAYARKVAVECRFENAVLTGFRWTEGPVRPSSTGQAP